MSQPLAIAITVGIACACTVKNHDGGTRFTGTGSRSRAPAWSRLPAQTDEKLVEVRCTPDGDVYAVDDQRRRHDICGHRLGGAAPWPVPPVRDGDYLYRQGGALIERSTDAGRTWQQAAKDLPKYRVHYGYSAVMRIAVAPGGKQVFALVQYTAVSNSLEDAYHYLLRSDDHGATWSQVWTGPNRGPMGGPDQKGPDLGALVVLADGTVMATDLDAPSVVVSSDGGETFIARPVPTREPLSDLAVGADGVIVGIGGGETMVVSTDAGKTFAAQPTDVTGDLRAVVSCRGSLWIVGDHAAILRHRAEAKPVDECARDDGATTR